MSDPSEPVRISETAEVIAKLVPSLPRRVTDDLGRLIQRRFTTLNPRAIRHARLGLLIDMVSVGTGEIPSVAEYEAQRAIRKRRGETWPAHGVLGDAYGGWINAIRAAMATWWNGSSSRTPFSNMHKIDPQRTYSHEEATSAFLRCAETLGVWPTEFEYDDWRRASRELALASGNPYPRYPSLPAWKRLFGGWVEFEEAARRAAIEHSEDAT